MKINSDRFEISNPILYYKLDPGEPGLATPARASESVGAVASHEIGNIIRFRKQAAENGGIVVYTNIYLNMQFAGSFLAATSGLSEAYIIYPAKTKNKNTISFEPGKNDKTKELSTENNQDKENVKSEKEDKNKKNVKSGLTNENLNNIESKIKDLENEKRIAEFQISSENENKDDFQENKVREIEEKIDYLNQKKMFEEQKELFQEFSEANNFAFSLIGLKYNTNLNDLGSLVDALV